MKGLIPSLKILLLFSFFFISSYLEAKNKLVISNPIDSLIDLATHTPDSMQTEAIKFLNQAVEILQNNEEKKPISEYFLKVGTLLVDKNEQSKALDLYQEGLDIAAKFSDSILIWKFNDAIGLLYYKKANYTLSSEYFFNALNIAEKIKDNQKTAISCDHIVRILKEQQEYNKALEYLNKSLDLKIKTSDKQGELTTLITIADINVLLNNLQKALEIYDKCEITAIQLSNKKQLSRVYSNIGNCYFNLKEYTSAEKYYLKGLKIKEELGDKYRLAIAYNNLSIFYKRISKLDAAYKAANKALEFSKETSAAYIELSCYLNLSHYYKLKNDFEKAYNFHRMYAALNDSLFNEIKTRQLAEIREKYETEKKEQQIHFLEVENKTQEVLLDKNRTIRNVASVSGLLFLLLFIVILYAYKQKQKANKALTEKNRQIYEQNIELDKLNETKNKLFSIIAHDLRSPLSSIEGVSELITKLLDQGKNDQILKLSKHIDQSVSNVNTLLDNLLNWALSQIKRLQLNYEKLDIYEVIKHCIKIHKTVAESKNIEIITSPVEKLHVRADLNLLRVILRNLLNNAIKFTPAGRKIEIQTNLIEKMVQVDIIDTGIGIDESRLENIFDIGSGKSREGTIGEKGSGLGLMICKEFIELNDGQIKIKSTLNKGTKVSFTVPYYI